MPLVDLTGVFSKLPRAQPGTLDLTAVDESPHESRPGSSLGYRRRRRGRARPRDKARPQSRRARQVTHQPASTLMVRPITIMPISSRPGSSATCAPGSCRALRNHSATPWVAPHMDSVLTQVFGPLRRALPARAVHLKEKPGRSAYCAPQRTLWSSLGRLCTQKATAEAGFLRSRRTRGRTRPGRARSRGPEGEGTRRIRQSFRTRRRSPRTCRGCRQADSPHQRSAGRCTRR